MSSPDPVPDQVLAIVPSDSSACERGLSRPPLAGGVILPETSYALSGALTLALMAWLAWTEGPLATVMLAIFVSGTVGALVALLTRRLLLAVVLTVAQVAVITTISSLKLKYMNMVLHAYDIAYYLMSSTNVGFLVANYGRPVLIALRFRRP